MLAFVRGKVASLKENTAILDTGTLGYEVFVPLNVAKRLLVGAEVLLHLSLVIREDAHLLFGFLEKEEKDFFILLTSLSGIGAKTALALLGHLSPSSLSSAVHAKNATLLTKVPGIGKKTAERLIVELKDKLLPFSPSSSPIADAISALIGLGYSPAAAQTALETAPPSSDLSSLIAFALKSPKN